MFDTIREKEMGLACATFGLGHACGGESRNRDHQKAHYHNLEKSIENLKNAISQLEKGTQQKQYNDLIEKQETLKQENINLEVLKQQNRLLAKAWEDEPDKRAQLEGLGWGFFKRMFSCDHYNNEAREWAEKSNSLSNKEGKLKGILEEKNKQLSSESMTIQQKAVAELEKKKALLTEENQGYLDSIEKSRNLWLTRKEAEKVAAIQAAQNAEKRRIKEENATKNKGTNTLILVALAVAGGYFFLKKNKSKKVAI